jgi:hypothetical protein
MPQEKIKENMEAKEKVKLGDAVTVSMTTVSIMTVSIMTVIIMPVSSMTVSIMTFCKMTVRTVAIFAILIRKNSAYGKSVHMLSVTFYCYALS